MSLRLAQLHDKMSGGREVPKLAPTPSPRSPNNSNDPLLPVVAETREVGVRSDWTLPLKEHFTVFARIASVSKVRNYIPT